MTELSQTIFDKYQVRNTKQQKTDFIDFLQRELPDLRVEEGGFGKNRNLILGDPDRARVVFTAHYDTCTTLPFPNFLTPKNIPLYVLYNLAITVVFFAADFLAAYVTAKLFHNEMISYFSGMAVVVLLLFLMLGGKPNQHTANDNTSGVITLCELYSALPEELRQKAAFVFFDNEELGLLGSRFFRKKHKAQMKETLLFNLDCVADGNYLMLIETKAARQQWGALLRQAFEDLPGKTVLWERSSNTLYPSDQAGFPCAVAAAAFNKGRCGLYLSRIHTEKDTVFQEENVAYLRDGGVKLLKLL